MKNTQPKSEDIDANSDESETTEVKKEKASKILNLNSFSPNGTRKEKIAIYQSPFYHIFPIKDIVYLEADGPYTHIHMESKKTLTACTNLRSYEELLCDYNFFRIHKSYLINLARVSRYCKAEGGYVLMQNNQKLYISSTRREHLLEKLELEVIVASKGSKMV